MTQPGAPYQSADSYHVRRKRLLGRLREADDALERKRSMKAIVDFARSFQSEKPRRSESLLQSALTITPDVTLAKPLANIMLRDGRASEAVCLVDDVLARSDRKVVLRLLLAEVSIESGHHAKARFLLERLKESRYRAVGLKARSLLNKLSFRETLTRASALEEAGDLLAATETYREALEKVPNDRDALRSLARVQYAQNDYEGATKTYCQISEQSWATVYDLKRLSRALLTRPSALEEAGDLLAATEAYREALEKVPNHRDALRSLARVQYAQHDYEGATKTYRQISQQSWSTFYDLKRLFRALRAARPSLMKRWLNMVRGSERLSRIDPKKQARLLAAANQDQDAIGCLRAIPVADWPEEMVAIAFHSFLQSCKFFAAQSLLDQRPDVKFTQYAETREKLRSGLQLAEAWGLSPECDFRVAALKRLLDLTVTIRRNYAPHPNNILLCLKQTTVGGLARQVQILGHTLCIDSNADVSVFSLLRMPDDGFLSSEPFDVRYADEFRNERRLSEKLDKGWLELNLISSLLQLDDFIPTMHALEHLRPAVVHNFLQTSVGVLLASVVMGVPRTVARLAGMHPQSIENSSDSPKFELMNIIYRFLEARNLISLSVVSKGALCSWSQHTDIPGNAFNVNYDAFDPNFLGEPQENRAAIRRSLGMPPDVSVVGGVFRMAPEKDPFLWLDVACCLADRLPEVRFLIVGTGPMWETFRTRAKSKGLGERIYMPGNVNVNLCDYYKAMDVFLHTSKREGFGNVVVEAQYFGLPVVAMPVGGIPEALAADHTGMMVRDRNPTTIADAVSQYLRDNSERRRIAAIAPSLVRQRFSPQANMAGYLEMYSLGDG